MNESNFQHILRVLNTNLDGKVKVMFALTNIKGVGRRFSNIACKKAEVDLNKRAGELTAEEVERLVTIVQNPRQFKVRDASALCSSGSSGGSSSGGGFSGKQTSGNKGGGC